MALALRAVPAFDDDAAIERLSRASPGWQIEYDASGTMLVSPTSSDGGARELEAGMQLGAYAKRYGGKAFGSPAGFRLRDRSVRSPDASWLSAERMDALVPSERTGFWRVCPDVVIEILSASGARVAREVRSIPRKWCDLCHRYRSVSPCRRRARHAADGARARCRRDHRRGRLTVPGNMRRSRRTA